MRTTYRFFTLLSIVCCGTLLSVHPCDAKTTKNSLQMPSTLGAGDEIRLNVSSHSSLSKKYQLNTRGEITLPFAGRVKLEGLTRGQAARRITSALSTHYRGLSGVRVIILAHKKFLWLRGWVKKPGRYLLGWNDSIGELLSQGGGAQPGARLEEVWLHSPGRAPQRFNLLKFYQDGQKATPPQLPRNTVVFVPLSRSHQLTPKSSITYLRSKSNSIAVFGAVQQPGVFPSFWPINLLQVLALARGPREPSALQEVFIVPPNEPALWFDLRAYFRSKKRRALPLVPPGSVVYVPTTPMGISRRGPIRILGRVAKPGVLRGTQVRDLSTLLAESGGPTADADLGAVRVVYRGSNFTISQEVDLKQAIAEGQLDRIPPTPPGPMIVHVPSRPQPSVVLTESINIIQLVVAITSVITSTVVLVVTLQTQSAQNAQNNQTNNQNP